MVERLKSHMSGIRNAVVGATALAGALLTPTPVKSESPPVQISQDQRGSQDRQLDNQKGRLKNLAHKIVQQSLEIIEQIPERDKRKESKILWKLLENIPGGAHTHIFRESRGEKEEKEVKTKWIDSSLAILSEELLKEQPPKNITEELKLLKSMLAADVQFSGIRNDIDEIIASMEKSVEELEDSKVKSESLVPPIEHKDVLDARKMEELKALAGKLADFKIWKQDNLPTLSTFFHPWLNNENNQQHITTLWGFVADHYQELDKISEANITGDALASLEFIKFRIKDAIKKVQKKRGPNAQSQAITPRELKRILDLSGAVYNLDLLKKADNWALRGTGDKIASLFMTADEKTMIEATIPRMPQILRGLLALLASLPDTIPVDEKNQLIESLLALGESLEKLHPSGE